ADRNQAALLELFEPHIDAETQTLAAIADFDLIAGLHVSGRYVLLLEPMRCVGCQVAENLRHFASTDLLERAHECSRALVTHRGRRIPERAQHSGTWRNN